ncbi:histidine kinase [Flammeovirgaceae bacterium KN852]|uniref:Histidine kinase n=2 Tax=Marinigracilibium pacificum TaxID=2729599 RepID=A0A848IZT7_9BACT|nr:histidine kinase [Marinigracilibium pacificum]
MFNAINGIYEIAVTEENEKIQESIIKLTDTLRYTIDSIDRDEVLVEQEINAINNYIDLQKIRFDLTDLKLDTEFDIKNLDFKIAPLLLLNFVENAFKHGYRHDKKSIISIKLEVNKKELILDIINTNHSQRINSDGGNHNSKKILSLKYPGLHRLIIKNEEKYFQVKLWIKTR